MRGRMPGKRRRRVSGHRRPLGVLAVVVGGVVALFLGWSAYAVVSNSDSTGSPDSHGPASTSGEQSRNQTAARACAAHISETEQVVSAASRGISHWHTHVRARTDMINGRISPERMSTLWKRTRLAGP